VGVVVLAIIVIAFLAMGNRNTTVTKL
jgi:hypothetical protein